MKSSIFLLLVLLTAPEVSASFLPPQDRKLATKTAVDSNFMCNQEMMLSYGLQGNTKPVNTPHKYCPGVTSNCCTLQDADTSMYLWTTDSKQRVERFYEVYLYMLKYLLGYSQEIGLLAKDYSTSNNSKCKSAANDFLSMNLNPKLTSIIYGSFADSVVALGNMRKGFYCVLCDAATQQSLKDFWSITNMFYNDRVYFSKEFCQTLVDKTIQSSYFAVTYIKRFADDTATLLSCKTGGSSSLQFEVSFFRKQQVKNCFFFRTKYFFFFCENYCERFDLVKPSDLLDNDISELKKFFTAIRDNKDRAFYNPSNNILMAGSYEERFVTEHLDYVTNTKVFFPAASSHQVDLAKFTTDVVYNGGMDPWKSVEASTYEMVIAGAGRWAVGMLASLAALLLLK